MGYVPVVLDYTHDFGGPLGGWLAFVIAVGLVLAAGLAGAVMGRGEKR